MKQPSILTLTVLLLAPLAALHAGDTPAKPGFSAYRSFDEMVRASDPVLPPTRAVTRGPKFHWFGYYDKYQLDPGNRYLLSMEVDFEHRLPKADEQGKTLEGSQRPSDLYSWHARRVAGHRHLSARCEAGTDRLSGSPAQRPVCVAGAVPVNSQRRVALRYAPPRQPGRQTGDHRFTARRQRQATVRHRHQPDPWGDADNEAGSLGKTRTEDRSCARRAAGVNL